MYYIITITSDLEERQQIEIENYFPVNFTDQPSEDEALSQNGASSQTNG